jgi:hypothetical protein
LAASNTGVWDGTKLTYLDWNVEFALLEKLEVVAEVTDIDAEDASVDAAHEGGAWIVFVVAGTATVVAEKMGAWVDVVVEILANEDVAVLWRLFTK